VADWAGVEAEIGVVLPDDLKCLVSSLGTGAFGYEFALFNPIASSKYIRLCTDLLFTFERNSADAAKQAGISLYPAKGGCLAIGEDGNGCNLLIEPDPAAQKWRRLVWFDTATSEAHFDRRCVSEFILDLYEGRIPAKWATQARRVTWPEGRPFFSNAYRGNPNPNSIIRS
jgi:hypothetical protein